MEGLAHGGADPAFELYRRLLGREWLEGCRIALGLRGGGGLFSAALTIWLVLRQRLLGGVSLDVAWSSLTSAQARSLSPESARAVKGSLSQNSSGFSYGRQALPLSLAIAACEHLTQEARQVLGASSRSTFLLDGTTLSPARTPALAKAFPPGSNQQGEFHWPVVLVVVAHELETGLAALPEWGAMYGPDNTSEQALAIRMADRLPKDCRIVADRNFGVFPIAWAFRERSVLVRLTRPRAQALAGKKVNLDEDLDMRVTWRPSASTRKNFPEIPPEAEIQGRLVVQHGFGPDGKAVVICLFSNDMETPADDLVLAYTPRWNVETDLRTLKQTVGLEVLCCRTPDMLRKELVLAVAAYNLVRTLMALAAQKAGLEPRRMSFARAKACIQGAGRVLAAPDPLEEILSFIAATPLPNRKDRASPPRHFWKRNKQHPARKARAK